MPRYNPAVIEPKWQQYWEANRTFATPSLPSAEKLYVLDMFPYPSGDGLHVGHPEGQTATDIICRYQRMRGRSVMHPMGWDAFGLPAEQHAIKTGTPPRTTTEKNIATFRRQEKMLGFSYDWDRELATTDVEYFRWTQWIFLVLFDTWFDEAQQKGRPITELPIPPEVQSQGDDGVRSYRDAHRLAYQLEAPVNWCPALGTVLANEEVVGGVSERGGHPVMRIPLRQWMLRITAYADRLEKDLDELDWSESIKLLQRNWIGRSTGAEVDFFIGDDTDRKGGRPGKAAFEQWTSARGKSGWPKQAGDDVVRVYTTRPDTLFGATYMVVAPEHPLVKHLTTRAQETQVRAYCDQAQFKSDLDRTDLAKDKTGVFTGSYALNPMNGESVPIWVADYVLISYGTGAIMAVPAHDTRDFEFADTFGIAIKAVVDPGNSTEVNRADVLAGKAAFTAMGKAVNSGKYNGLPTDEFKKRITADLEQQGLGCGAVNYKLRDWLFSRQHFWGEPFPILHELDAKGRPTGRIRAVDEKDLPVTLPDMPHFKPHGRPEPPLEEANEEWLYPTIDGVRYKRETNTMPQWAGSCWYYLRFLDPRNNQCFVDPEIERAWMPVDIYIGGAEHAVLHLLYSRFWHKVLYDRGHVSTKEPFRKLVNQGMILGEVELHRYETEDGELVPAADVGPDAEGRLISKISGETVKAIRLVPSEWELTQDRYVARSSKQGGPPSVLQSRLVSARSYKMSKSRGNVVNPDTVVREYGADALRLFEMFMGPLEAVKPWSTEGVNGVRGFLDRVWRMIVNDRAEQLELNAAVNQVAPTDEQNRVLHRTIQGVTHDIERMQFNTAIAKMMEFTNFFTRADVRPKSAMASFAMLLSPFAPHIAEELWQLLGHAKSLAYEPWPTSDERWLKEDTVEIPVQVNGKLRAQIRVPADADNAAMEAAARADERVSEHLSGKTVSKVVVVPKRMVNFVVK